MADKQAAFQAMIARSKTMPKKKGDAEDAADKKKGKFNVNEESAEEGKVKGKQ